MNQQPVYTFAKWIVKDNQLPTVLNLVAELIQKSITEEGNLFYKIHQSITDKNTLLLYEGYVDETALDIQKTRSISKN